YLADQRIAVGMRAARGEPEDHIARPDRAPVDNAVLLHHAEREAGKIVFVLGEGVRMLGRLAADQRAAGQLATRSDTLDDLRRNEHVGPQRAPGERLDRLDQRVAGLDVDAGVAVGKSFRHARVQILLDMPALASPQLWAWITIALAAGFLVWLLSPILAPFLFAAILAYIFDPLVERLTRQRLPRTLSVVLVLLLAVAVALAMMLVVLPLFYKETRLLTEKLPGFFAWFNAHAAPWLKASLGL